jgi:hypothetical protein
LSFSQAIDDQKSEKPPVGKERINEKSSLANYYSGWRYRTLLNMFIPAALKKLSAGGKRSMPSGM